MAESTTWTWNKELHTRYVHELPVRKTLVEYIYVDDDDVSVHSKCRTFDEEPQTVQGKDDNVDNNCNKKHSENADTSTSVTFDLES